MFEKFKQWFYNSDGDEREWREYDRRTLGNRDKCLHNACPECHGTGRKKLDGSMCIHNISCPCKKCNVY